MLGSTRYKKVSNFTQIHTDSFGFCFMPIRASIWKLHIFTCFCIFPSYFTGFGSHCFTPGTWSKFCLCVTQEHTAVAEAEGGPLTRDSSAEVCTLANSATAALSDARHFSLLWSHFHVLVH